MIQDIVITKKKSRESTVPTKHHNKHSYQLIARFKKRGIAVAIEKKYMFLTHPSIWIRNTSHKYTNTKYTTRTLFFKTIKTESTNVTNSQIVPFFK